MNIETKVVRSFNILYTDYAFMMGHASIGFYYNLMWLDSRSLGKPLTLDYIKSKIKLSEDEIKLLIQRLLCLSLLSKKRVENGEDKDWEFVPIVPDYLSKDEKIEAVEKMFKKMLIKENEKYALIEYINDNIKDNTEITVEHVDHITKDKDFNEPAKEVGEDTYLGLVHYYYRELSRVFGGRWVSRADKKEAANLKICMDKNGDSPEVTRQCFDWVIARAKKHGLFEKVSSMGLYPEFRKHAIYHLYIKQTGDSKFEETSSTITIEEDQQRAVDNMSGLYDLYVADGLNQETIIAKFKEAFADQHIEAFLASRSLNAV
jgi:hypothetical protein